VRVLHKCLDKTEEKLSGWGKLSTTKDPMHENRNPYIKMLLNTFKFEISLWDGDSIRYKPYTFYLLMNYIQMVV
jgi:hypothetical protein